jgi:hypothetical protein
VVTDGGGIPLANLATPANTPDAAVLAAMVDRVEPIKRPRGRPRKRPDKLHTDEADDHAKHRKTLRDRGMTPRIARKGIEAKEHLGRHRWVVERSIAWLLGCHRLGLRYERRADLLQGLLHLACALICLRFLDPAPD